MRTKGSGEKPVILMPAFDSTFTWGRNPAHSIVLDIAARNDSLPFTATPLRLPSRDFTKPVNHPDQPQPKDIRDSILDGLEKTNPDMIIIGGVGTTGKKFCVEALSAPYFTYHTRGTEDLIEPGAKYRRTTLIKDYAELTETFRSQQIPAYVNDPMDARQANVGTSNLPLYYALQATEDTPVRVGQWHALPTAEDASRTIEDLASMEWNLSVQAATIVGDIATQQWLRDAA